MNEKIKEMIEEMAKDLCANCRKDGYSCSLYSSDDDWVCVQERERAEHLINAGYRKIPEGAVVLTKEEYEKLQALKGYEAGVEECWDNARADIAKMFIELMRITSKTPEEIYYELTGEYYDE
jgi:hypothetical protein